MDAVDRDQQFEEKIHAQRIQAAAKVMDQPKATGHCLNCQTKLRKKDQRWCDEYCRDDWQLRKDRQA